MKMQSQNAKLLDYQNELKEFWCSNKGWLFGWRPTELKITPFPWDVVDAENTETAGGDIDEGDS